MAIMVSIQTDHFNEPNAPVHKQLYFQILR